MSTNSLLAANDLVKDSGKIRKTVVFVGNGAIEGGWDPLRSVLNQMIQSDSDNDPAVNALRRQNSESFHQLAILSYKFKFARAEQFMAWKNHIETPIQTEANGIPKLEGFLNLRSRIAEAFTNQATSLSLRTSQQIKTLIGEEAAYITANWDETLWRDSSIVDLVQFHGRCAFDHSIVFPTELLIEDAAYDLLPMISAIQRCSPAFQAKIYSAFRYLSMTALVVHGISTVRKWLENCERLVIWGYSLADYDADVNAAIATFLSGAARELIIINPDSNAFDRAVALTNITNATHFNPVTGISRKFS